jgi:hypothetical protein
VNAPVARNVSGSAGSCRLRSAIWCWMTKDCETRSAGRCSTADGRDGLCALPNKRFDPTPLRGAAYAKDVAILSPKRIAAIIESAGFEPPVQFFQAGLMHAWFAKRSPSMAA